MELLGGRAGRYEPELEDWRETLAVHAFRVVLRLWCWRELSLPALALVVLYKTGHVDLAIGIGALLLCAIVLLLFICPRTLVRVLRRCRARSDMLTRQIRWPRLCRELGWARRLDKGGWLVPELLSWKGNEQQVTFQIRPLPEHGASKWDQMADALRRLVGGATVHWREAHGTLTVIISRVALPTTLRWAPGGSDRRRVVIGQRHGGTDLVLDVGRTPHLLLAGATGSGKGATIRAMLAGALQVGWQRWCSTPRSRGSTAGLSPSECPCSQAQASSYARLRS